MAGIQPQVCCDDRRLQNTQIMSIAVPSTWLCVRPKGKMMVLETSGASPFVAHTWQGEGVCAPSAPRIPILREASAV